MRIGMHTQVRLVSDEYACDTCGRSGTKADFEEMPCVVHNRGGKGVTKRQAIDDERMVIIPDKIRRKASRLRRGR
jgi:hypothetical protein